MPNRMDDALWKAYRAGWIQAASEYGGPEYERTVAEAEAHACKYAEVRATPTPARFEAAGGEEASASEAALRSMLAWQHEHGESLTMSVRQCPVSAQDIRNVLAELTSLRQQLAAAREDGGLLDVRFDLVDTMGVRLGMTVREFAVMHRNALAARIEPSGEVEAKAGGDDGRTWWYDEMTQLVRPGPRKHAGGGND